MTDQNEVTVQELAQARKANDMAQAKYVEANNIFNTAIIAIPEHDALQKTGKKASEELNKLADLETKFKAQLIAKFAETGEKQHNGGSVAVGKKFFYDDDAVIAWLRDHNFGNLITETYKKTDVKPMHKENNPVDGITTEETITPKIDTDLSEFLPDNQADLKG